VTGFLVLGGELLDNDVYVVQYCDKHGEIYVFQNFNQVSQTTFPCPRSILVASALYCTSPRNLEVTEVTRLPGERNVH